MKVQQSVHGLGVDPRGEVVMSPAVLQHGGARDDVAPRVERGVRIVAKVVVGVNLREGDCRTTIKYLECTLSTFYQREKDNGEKNAWENLVIIFHVVEFVFTG